MKATENKSSTTANLQTKQEQAPFFKKEGQDGFFSTSTEQATPFFSPTSPFGGGAGGGLQPKLKVGQPNDKYEKEADSVADTVAQRLAENNSNTGMSPSGGGEGGGKTGKNSINQVVQRKTPDNEEQLQKKEEQEEISLQEESIQRKPIFESNEESTSPLGERGVSIQRKCADCGANLSKAEDEKLQKQEDENIQLKFTEEDLNTDISPSGGGEGGGTPQKEEPLMMKSESAETVGTSTLQSQLDASKGKGSSLPENTRTDMESTIGADFSGVSIHTDNNAVQMNKDLGAKAFTHGSDIYFNQGQYDTNSSSGQHLLAHELTHTVQQGAAGNQNDEISQSRGEIINDSERNTNVENESVQESIEDKQKGDSPEQIKPDTENKKTSPLDELSQNNEENKKNIGETSENTSIESAENSEPQRADQTQVQEQTSSMMTGAGGGGNSAAPTPPELSAESSTGLLNSLSSNTPTGFIQGMNEAKSLAPQIQQNENDELVASLPEITQPTGLPVTIIETETQDIVLETQNAGTPEVQNEQGPLQIQEEHQQLEGNVNIANIPTPRASAEEDQNFAENIKNATASLPTSDSTINTSAGERPSVNLTGEANPQLNEEGQQLANENVAAQQLQADSNVNNDFGENNIFPTYNELEQLRPEISERQSAGAGESQLESLPETSAEVYASFDNQAQASMNEQVGAEMTRHEEERERMNVESENERMRGMAEIEQETERTRLEQEAIQAGAREEVAGHQQSWREENQAVRDEYSQRSSERRAEIDTQINSEVSTAETQVETELTAAENRAETERENAEGEARRRRAEAEREQENQGFWDRVTSAVSSFFDALKEGLNALFDTLRQAVAAIIEAAKAVVNTIIDAARNLIINLIKGFGEFLKGLVNIALAAFPEIAERINGWIDQAVEVAVDAVNALADALKEIANAILDAVGAVLDFILSVYQAFFNALLDVLEFIVIGLLKILEGLANLVSAAINMPDQFWGQVSEEFLGMDVTSPLPFEKTEHVAGNTGGQEVSSGVTDQELANNFTNQEGYTEEDFNIDPVPQNTELSSEMMMMISQMREGQELNFGENNNTVDDFFGELAGGDESESNENVDAGLPDESVPVNNVNTTLPQNDIPTDPYAQVDWFIAQQNSQGSGANNAAQSAEGGGQPADSTSFPEEMKQIGPLTVGARLYYLRRQMTDAIKKKWQESKWKYIGIGAGVVAGITALAIATGGAIFGLIPPALQIFAAIMGGLAVVKAGQFFGKYISEGWGGNILQGAKNLARSIGILLVELIFILLFDMNTVLKVLKAGVKGSVKMAAQGAKNTFKALGTAAKASGKGLVKTGGRMVAGVRGIGKSSLKGIRSIDDLGRRLARKFRFKGFKLQRRGWRFNLLGNINPWVLLASGEVKEISRADLDRQITNRTKLGGMVDVGGQRGIVVGGGDEASNLTRFLQDNAGRGGSRLDVNRELAERLLSRPVSGGTSLYNAAADVIISNYRQADRLLRSGTVASEEQLRAIISNSFRNGNSLLSLESMLIRLERLSRFQTQGLNTLLSDLAHPWFEKVMGAEWVLKYITDGDNLFVASVRTLEDTSAVAGRRIDAVINGINYEFKNLKNFRGDRFVEQIAKEFQQFRGGLGQRVRWIFNDRVGTRGRLMQQMRNALDNPEFLRRNGLSRFDARAIKNALDDIVEVSR